ncbi:MAG: DNA cytosine methyltransferase [Candidatus Sumerlaeaceae bacterium]
MLVAFDFFCGAGGLTRGLLDSGIKVLAGFDKEASCEESYKTNNGDAKFICTDICDITLGKLIKLNPDARNFRNVIFAGCAPCQPFSSHRRAKTFTRDATLLLQFGRLVKAARPGWVLIENVPGMAKIKGFSAFRRFLATLASCDYEVDYGVLDAKQFGVPQTRRRLVLLASRHVPVTLPKPKFGPVLRPYRTVRQAITHFPQLPAGGACDEIPNHVASVITQLNLERLAATPIDGGTRAAWPAHLHLKCHSGGYAGHTDVYGRMAWDEPSPTLTGKCNSISNGRYGHPTQHRAISLREAAAIQSFPDGYQFFGSMGEVATQIGNAVPVKLAHELGKHIIGLAAHQQGRIPT